LSALINGVTWETYPASRRENRELVLFQDLRQLMVSYVRLLAEAGQLTPKSANASSASSALLLNKIFSGFKSAASASCIPSKEERLTSVDDSLIVQILDCTRDCPDDVLGIPEYQPSPVLRKTLNALFVVTSASTNSVEQLSTGTEIKD